MREYFRKSDLVLGDISLVLTTDVSSGFAIIEINGVEFFLDSEGEERFQVLKNGVTSVLDSDELDEIILMLRQASDTLKRAEKRDGESV